MANLTIYEVTILKSLSKARAEGAQSVAVERLVAYVPGQAQASERQSGENAEPRPVEIGRNLRILKRKKFVHFENGSRIAITSSGLIAIGENQ